MKLLRNQSGIAHLAAILVVVVLASAAFVGWRVLGAQKDAKPQQNTSGKPVEDNLELKNLGLASMDSVLVAESALRDYESMGLRGFYLFGDKLGNDNARKNPNFEFSSLKPGTEVIAAIDGVIVHVREQSDGDDSEVFLQTRDGSQWMIGYDHLINLKVKKGQQVKVGDVLGEPAPQGNGSLRFEFQVNKEAGSTEHVCPSTLLAKDVAEKTLAELRAMMDLWNQIGRKTLYTFSDQSPVGCLVKTLTPEQAQGKQ